MDSSCTYLLLAPVDGVEAEHLKYGRGRQGPAKSISVVAEAQPNPGKEFTPRIT